MKISVQKLPVFALEHKFFDQLANANDIAIYAFLVRIDGFAYSDKLIMEALNLSKKSFDKSINKLLEIGFLKLNKDI